LLHQLCCHALAAEALMKLAAWVSAGLKGVAQEPLKKTALTRTATISGLGEPVKSSRIRPSVFSATHALMGA
jgi:hypothetical protein